MTQRKLTERLGVQPASASEVLAKLETAGMIVRTPSEMDRRTVDVALTEAGAAHAGEASCRGLLDPLDAQERETLRVLLEKIASAAWK